QRALGAFQHLDPGHVVERHQRAAGTGLVDAVDVDADCRIGADAEIVGFDAAQAVGRLGRVAAVDHQPRHEQVGLAEVGGGDHAQLSGGDDGHRDRHILHFLAAALRGDRDLAQFGGMDAGAGRRRGSLLCRCERYGAGRAGGERAGDGVRRKRPPDTWPYVRPSAGAVYRCAAARAVRGGGVAAWVGVAGWNGLDSGHASVQWNTSNGRLDVHNAVIRKVTCSQPRPTCYAWRRFQGELHMGFFSKLVRHKSVEQLQAEVGSRGDFRRVLGLWQLTAIGIGGIIGVGIFVLAGQQAATNAGPAVALSFIIAGLGSACAALCYAEFAGLIPVTGSAYTYGYAVLGEFVAWIIGWDLLLEYALVVAVVAIGWSGYVQVLLTSAGVHLPEWAQQSMSAQTMQYYLQQVFGVHGQVVAGPSDG